MHFDKPTYTVLKVKKKDIPKGLYTKDPVTGELLFNKEEADILLHRPVTPSALLWAKIGVLLRVSLWLAGAFNLASFVDSQLTKFGVDSTRYSGKRSSTPGYRTVVNQRRSP